MIDGYGKTNVPGIYAIGDVAGPPMLAHKAEHEGVICVEAIKGLHPHPMDKNLIPGCTYCHPQIASVGLTEAKAKEGGREIRVGRFPFVGNGKAIALGEDQGLVKVIFDKKTGQLLGAHMVGAEVTELIQGFVVAMNLETTEEELMHTIFPHPTTFGNDEGSGARCLRPSAEHVGCTAHPRPSHCSNNEKRKTNPVKDNDNLTIERPTFVTHLECAMEGDHYPADQVHNLSKAGKPLLVRYDLAGVKKALTKDALAQRPPDLWRYREMLPVRKVTDIVSLGEAMTPLIRLPKLAKKLGGGEIIVKDEGRLPTGSFKARGLVMAVSMAQGARHQAHGDADQRQCRRGARRLCQPLRHQDHDLLSGRYAGSERQRDRAAGRHRLSRQRPDRRLRQDRRRGQGQGRLVRHLDAEGAVPDRRQEDDGAGARRTARLGRARRDLLSDRRRHRPDRHVEGVCRTGGHRLHRLEAAAHDRGAGVGLRADGARL